MNAPLPSTHFSDTLGTGLRFRTAGEMVLDVVHTDARVDDRWLDLCPREFALLWRLAATPGERLCRTQLRAEAWHTAFDPENDGVAVHIDRVRAKLASGGVGHLICTDGDGRHFLQVPPFSGLVPPASD